MKRAIYFSLALSAAAACRDAPTAPTREIALCSFRAWMAYQNEGESWTRVTGSNGRFTFRATERLAVAVSSGDPDYPLIEVSFLTSQQAVATFPCPPPPLSLGKRLHGAVRGLKANEEAYVRYGLAIAAASAAFPSFTIEGVPEGTLDLVATRILPYSSTAPSLHIDRVIIRRGENRVDGSTIPTLNFDSTEAFAPQTNVLTITGVPAGALMGAQTNFTTQSGTDNPLRYDPFQNGVATAYAVPASHRIAGDLHYVDIGAGDRRLLYFYSLPADRTLALGPAPSLPMFTTVTDSPILRVRADVTAQPEYGSAINLYVFQQPPLTANRHTVAISATKEYFGGTPATWSLTIPDLSGVEGFQSSWGLQPGPYAWSLLVHSWPFGFSPRSAQDGQTLRSAHTRGP